MRHSFGSLGLLVSLVAMPVAAQWSPSSATFVPGSTNNTVEFAIPVPVSGIDDFEGLQILFTYDSNVFEPLALTHLPTSNDVYFDLVNSSLVGSALTLIGSDLTFPSGVFIPGPGTLYKARIAFNVLDDAPLGSTTVTAAFDTFSGYSDSVSFQATIAAVPEPETWATMLAGLALIGSAVVRTRRKSTYHAA